MTDPTDIVTTLRKAEWYCNKSEEHMGYCDRKCARRKLPNPDECHKAADEIERLREQLRLANIDAFNSAAEADTLRAERDEARQFVCNREYLMTGMSVTPEEIAKDRGWDCFKENTDA